MSLSHTFEIKQVKTIIQVNNNVLMLGVQMRPKLALGLLVSTCRARPMTYRCTSKLRQGWLLPLVILLGAHLLMVSLLLP